MIFHKAKICTPMDKLYCVEKWDSETGKYSVRLDKVMFGCRVHVQHESNNMTYYTDICSGADPDWQAGVFYAVLKYLEQFPEDVHPGTLWDEFPTIPQPKPLYRALESWQIICRFAKLPTTDIHEVSALAKKIGIHF